MKWIVLVVALAGCQRSKPDKAASPPPGAKTEVAPSAMPAPAAASGTASDAYKADIQALCDVVHLSGADNISDAERASVTGIWLAQHIATEEAHQFLVKIQPLQGDAKANALDAEAHRIGLGHCALADDWRVPH